MRVCASVSQESGERAKRQNWVEKNRGMLCYAMLCYVMLCYAMSSLWRCKMNTAAEEEQLRKQLSFRFLSARLDLAHVV